MTTIDNRASNQGAQGNFYGPVQFGGQVLPPPALHQLRAPVGDFVGRAGEIQRLVAALTATNGAVAAISGVRGMGGIGKTELAYAASQQLSARFPDAQLLVELHGASSTPLSPAQALQVVIRAFEREAKLPDDLSQLQGIYRSVLSGKRALILADDARDAAQVRPLLPPPGCALLITSRNRFTLPGMAALDLGTLPPEEAEKLLLEICPRIGAHAPPLAKLCGYLPLALRVSAGLLASSDTYSIARYAGQLAGAQLKYLRDPDAPDDPQASVEASLQLSYDALDLAARLALCQLSVFPTSFDPAAALAVVAVDANAAEVLELLRRRSLLDWDEKLQRYSLHDLVRAFGAARLTDADAVRLRYAGFYAQLARNLEELYTQGGKSTVAALASFDTARVHFDTGWKWLIRQKASSAGDLLLRDYGYLTLYIGLLRYHPQKERIPLLEATLAAARRLGDRGAEGAWLRNLGMAYADLGDARKAIEFYEQALVITREIGDHRGEGATLNSLGIASYDLGDARKAIEFYEQALVITREIGDQFTESSVLTNLGIAYRDLGDVHKAIEFYEQALVITREIGNRRGEGMALGNLGVAYSDLGDVHKVIEFYEQNLTIAREVGDQRGEAIINWNLGLLQEKQGNLARAVELMQIYVDYLSELGHPDAEKRAAYLRQVRQRLSQPE